MTKYPIILVHGIAMRDSKVMRAFGKIEKKLKEAGYSVYTANTDAFGTIENNAEQLREIILGVIANTECERVNIIAHSKGGLDSKYMISRLGMADKVASLTTLCTPHKGSPVATKIWALPRWIKRCLTFFINTFYKLIGDENPDSLKVCEQLKSSEEIENTEGLEAVYCQSYSTSLRRGKDCLLMAVPMKMCVSAGEVENDGVVSTESSKFGVYKGDCTDESISHTQIIDFLARRRNRHKIYQFYIDLCSELGDTGY